MIELSGVTKTYPGGTQAVKELDLAVQPGEIVCLVGPSGCGKSTTLKMINRLIEPTSGTIRVNGIDITKTDPVQLRRGIGYVIQHVGLFPHQRILANVMSVPRLLGVPKSVAASRAQELLAQVGLDPADFAKRYPHQLSGGQQQRVGLARALAADPPVLLMDEPFGAVDPLVRVHLQDFFLDLQKTLHKTVVMVTHDIDEAVKMGDRVAVFNTHGELAQFARPATLLAQPSDDFVADFVGRARGLRRLAVTPINPERLLPVNTIAVSQLGAAVDRRASLEDVLALMMREDRPMVGVTDGPKFIGVLTPDSVHAMLRADIHDDLVD